MAPQLPMQDNREPINNPNTANVQQAEGDMDEYFALGGQENEKINYQNDNTEINYTIDGEQTD
jgi:hypothetical protein